MLRKAFRGALAAGTTLLLIGLGGAAAHAVPTPDSGPVSGGTQVAVEVPAVTFTSVASNSTHSLAIASDGNLYAWGSNRNGGLGDGTDVASPVPIRVKTPPGVTFSGDTAIAVGYGFSLAVGSDGNTYAWGHSAFGQMGNGQTGSSSTYLPTLVTTPPGVTFTSVTAGSFHALAIGSDGNAYGWGQNVFGQLGDGTAGVTEMERLPVPVKAPPGVTFTSINAGNQHSLALDADGNAYTWGYNYSGQLGNGNNATNSDTSVPVLLTAPPGVTYTDIIGGSVHSMAIGSDGIAYAWGENENGQLGDGSDVDNFLPTPVVTPPGVTFTSLGAGVTHSVASGSDGNVYTWGGNRYGQLGNDTIGEETGTRTPTLASTPPGVTFTDVLSSEASDRNFAKGSDGKIYVWGYNTGGMLGTGTGGEDHIAIPTPLLAETVATSVTFDDLPGTELEQQEGDTWTVTTPAHAAGPVDVVISWTFNGAEGTPITHAGGFTYVDPDVAPTVTNPADQDVTTGQEASFTVETTGAPSPMVTWEVSTDGGKTWTVVTAGSGTTISDDGHTLTVITAAAHNGNQYRATATNTAGEAVSDPALLTVTAESDGGNPTEGGTTEGNSGEERPGGGTPGAGKPGVGTSGAGKLPVTGAPAGGALLGAGLALLAVGTACAAIALRRKAGQ